MTLTIDLPESLTEQLRKRGIPETELQAVAVAALEIWISHEQSTTNGGRFSESAVPFVRRLIEENRQLFDELAQR